MERQGISQNTIISLKFWFGEKEDIFSWVANANALKRFKNNEAAAQETGPKKACETQN